MIYNCRLKNTKANLWEVNRRSIADEGMNLLSSLKFHEGTSYYESVNAYVLENQTFVLELLLQVFDTHAEKGHCLLLSGYRDPTDIMGNHPIQS